MVSTSMLKFVIRNVSGVSKYVTGLRYVDGSIRLRTFLFMTWVRGRLGVLI